MSRLVEGSIFLTMGEISCSWVVHFLKYEQWADWSRDQFFNHGRSIIFQGGSFLKHEQWADWSRYWCLEQRTTSHFLGVLNFRTHRSGSIARPIHFLKDNQWLVYWSQLLIPTARNDSFARVIRSFPPRGTLSMSCSIFSTVSFILLCVAQAKVRFVVEGLRPAGTEEWMRTGESIRRACS